VLSGITGSEKTFTVTHVSASEWTISKSSSGDFITDARLLQSAGTSQEIELEENFITGVSLPINTSSVTADFNDACQFPLLAVVYNTNINKPLNGSNTFAFNANLLSIAELNSLAVGGSKTYADVGGSTNFNAGNTLQTVTVPEGAYTALYAYLFCFQKGSGTVKVNFGINGPWSNQLNPLPRERVSSQFAVDMSNATATSTGALHYKQTLNLLPGQYFDITFSGLKAYTTIKSNKTFSENQRVSALTALASNPQTNTMLSLNSATLKDSKNLPLVALSMRAQNGAEATENAKSFEVEYEVITSDVEESVSLYGSLVIMASLLALWL